MKLCVKCILLTLLTATPFLSVSNSYADHWNKGWKKPCNENKHWAYHESYHPVYYRTAPHAGQVDSDGILSPGEIPNPLINYNRYNERYYNSRPVFGISWHTYSVPAYQEKPCDLRERDLREHESRYRY